MYYYKHIENNTLYEGTVPPIKPEKFIELTEEEYLAALKELEAE
jgi:hypothetical protein